MVCFGATVGAPVGWQWECPSEARPSRASSTWRNCVTAALRRLDAVAALVAKHEDVSGQRIGLQVLTDLLGEAIEAAAQIDRLAAEPDADGRRKAQHGGTSSRTASSCRKVTGSKPGATRRRR